MNLNSNDYKNIICARVDHIRMALYPQQYGNAPAVGGGNYNPPPADPVPNFEMVKSILGEITELVNDFETSIGPA